MNVPKSVFTVGLDEVATKYLKHTNPVNEPEMQRVIAWENLKVAEALLFSPKVIFKVYGENVVVPLLINHFGTDGIHKLLDDGGLEFMLWDQDITYLVEPIRGVDPLQYVKLNSEPHCNPKSSAVMGINGWASSIPRSERDSLARKVSKATKTLPKDAAQSAVSSVMEHVKRGDLISFGVDPGKDDWTMDSVLHKRICSFAAKILEGTILTREGTELMHSADVWDAVVSNIRTIQLPDGLHDATSTILAIEGLPDVPKLILDGSLKFADIIELRNRPETKELRRWLWARDRSLVSDNIATEYQDFLVGKFRKGAHPVLKAGRISAISIVGSVIGSILGGPVGGVVGTAIGTAAGTAVALFDGLIGDRILHGDNPRSFSTDVIRPLYITEKISKFPPR